MSTQNGQTRDERMNERRRKATGQDPPRLETMTAAQLMAKELPEPQWAVPGLIPQGLSLLSGKPKLGKSWIALQTGLAIAAGGNALGIRVEPGDVLYLAMEDTERRMQDRIGKLLHGAPPPDRFHFTLRCPPLDQGGYDYITDWLDRHPQARFVVADTLAKMRRVSKSNGNMYQDDYRDTGDLKRLADERRVAMVAVHHLNKRQSEDPHDLVSGSLGITGAADASLVLKRARGEHQATLFGTGRDFQDDLELALSWDPARCLWSILGDAGKVQRTKQQQEVLDLLQRLGRAAKPAEIAMRLDQKSDTIRQRLRRMTQDGLLVVDAEGFYRLPTKSQEGSKEGK